MKRNTQIAYLTNRSNQSCRIEFAQYTSNRLININQFSIPATTISQLSIHGDISNRFCLYKNYTLYNYNYQLMQFNRSGCFYSTLVKKQLIGKKALKFGELKRRDALVLYKAPGLLGLLKAPAEQAFGLYTSARDIELTKYIANIASKISNFIMLACFVKGKRRNGRRMFAYKMLSRSLIEYNLRNRYVFTQAVSQDAQESYNNTIFCKIKVDKMINIADKNQEQELDAYSRSKKALKAAFFIQCQSCQILDPVGNKYRLAKKQSINAYDRLIVSSFGPAQSSMLLRTAKRSTCKTLTLLDVSQNSIKKTNHSLFSRAKQTGLNNKQLRFVINKTRTSSKQRLDQAVFHACPSVEVRKVRIGGALYQVPAVINRRRQEQLALRALIMFAVQKRDSATQKAPIDKTGSLRVTNLQIAKGATQYVRIETRKPKHKDAFYYDLSLELAETRKKSSLCVNKRDQMHNIALTNRGYMHYRWW